MNLTEPQAVELIQILQVENDQLIKNNRMLIVQRNLLIKEIERLTDEKPVSSTENTAEGVENEALSKGIHKVN